MQELDTGASGGAESSTSDTMSSGASNGGVNGMSNGLHDVPVNGANGNSVDVPNGANTQTVSTVGVAYSIIFSVPLS